MTTKRAAKKVAKKAKRGRPVGTKKPPTPFTHHITFRDTEEVRDRLDEDAQWNNRKIGPHLRHIVREYFKRVDAKK